MLYPQWCVKYRNKFVSFLALLEKTNVKGTFICTYLCCTREIEIHHLLGRTHQLPSLEHATPPMNGVKKTNIADLHLDLYNVNNYLGFKPTGKSFKGD